MNLAHTFPRMIAMPMKTVRATTATLARKRTKVPTELMAATRIAFDVSILKARRAAEQKLYPYIAVTRVRLKGLS